MSPFKASLGYQPLLFQEHKVELALTPTYTPGQKVWLAAKDIQLLASYCHATSDLLKWTKPSALQRSS